eukprot:UN28271
MFYNFPSAFRNSSAFRNFSINLFTFLRNNFLSGGRIIVNDCSLFFGNNRNMWTFFCFIYSVLYWDFWWLSNFVQKIFLLQRFFKFLSTIFCMCKAFFKWFCFFPRPFSISKLIFATSFLRIFSDMIANFLL